MGYKISEIENKIICGDNLEVLQQIPDNSIDLIYIDPPFFSNRHYEEIWHDGAEVRSFEDRWKGGINQYLNWMESRLRQLHRILKDTGSVYLHCDWHAGHYLKVLMDSIFDNKNFMNEIVWCYRTGGASKEHFSRKHDTIFFYSRSNKKTFNPIKERIYYEKPFFSPKVDDQGRYFADVLPVDWWEIPAVINISKERVGYPTQKPEALLERIINASSNEGDIVLDAFCGCGTTIAVAHKLKRNWIGIDVSPNACRLIQQRLRRLGVTAEIIGMPTTEAEIKALSENEFLAWVGRKLQARINPKRTGDMGIDGWCSLNQVPIQIKQSVRIGRNVVDNFESAIRRMNKNQGVIVAFSFTRGAYDEVARIRKELDIKLTTVKELLESK